MTKVRKKMRPRDWAKLHFTDDALPSLNTLKKWIRTGVVDGAVVGGQHYIYEDSPLRESPQVCGGELPELDVSDDELDDFLAA